MSKPIHRGSRKLGAQSTTFKLRPIVAACSMMMVSTVVHAAGETSATAIDTGETVVVTGLRHSIETSIATKKESDSIVEVVTAEDIGKLPDVSIAENLARLPGLTAQRVDGRAQSISIRGMGPKYGVTLLNNREIVSTGDSRSFEYDQFPSELLSSAIVYKTPDASLSAMGLSGTVNLLTVRPLDFNERKVSLNIRAERAGNGELIDGTDDFGGRFSASYIDQFADGKVGISLGYAHLDNPGQEKYHKTWGWQDATAYQPSWCGGGCSFSNRPGVLPGQIAPTGFETGVNSTDRRRDGFMGVLEFKPNDKFHSQVDLFYSKFYQASKMAEMQGYTGFWGAATYANTTVDSRGVVTSADLMFPAGIGPAGNSVNDNFRFMNRYNKREDDTLAIGWNNELKLNKWKLGVDLSYSRAKRDEYNGEQYAQLATPGSAHWDIKSSSPLGDYAAPGAAKLVTLFGHGGRASMPHVKDDMKAFQLTAERMFDDSPVTSVAGGVKYSVRTKDMNRKEDYYNLNGAGNPAAPIDFPVGVPGFDGVPGWNYKATLANNYTIVDALASQPWNIPGRRWGVEEKVTTVFAKMNFDVDMKVPVRGNLGVQAIHTESTSDGHYFSGGKVLSVTKDNDYNDVLPSLNMTFDFGNLIAKGLYTRFGAARELARPVMDDLRAGGEAGMGTTLPMTWSGKGGNPYLEPWRAIAYDFSLEKYFGKRSYVAAAYFRKRLLNPIFAQTTTFNFSGIPLPDAAAAALAANPSWPTPSSTGTYTAPDNGKKAGKVEGVELSTSLDFGLLSDKLDGFGFIGSVSKTRSNITERGTNIYGDPISTSTPLEGLSGIVRSLTAYYERYGFSARINSRYRSGSSVMTRNQFGDPALSVIEPEKIVDLQLGYAFETGQLKGLSVTFQVNNLTDEPYRTSVTSDDGHKMVLPERYNLYGRQYLLGATYKF